MKKILIFSHAMEIGGAECALLGLLENIDTTKYPTDLFLMRHSGELLKYIPDTIHLLPEIPQYASLAISMREVLKKKQFRVAFQRFIGKRKAKRRVVELNLKGENAVALEYSHKYTLDVMPEISETEYDLAISFLAPHYFVAQRVKAKKKVAWIHTDYAIVKVDVESEKKMWDQYDVIASISEDVSVSFLKIFPSLKQKLELIPNIMPKEYIKEQSKAFSAEEEMPHGKETRLLSIGRFTYQKNFDNVPSLCKRLVDKGLCIKWYLIGYGGQEDLIREKITEYGMEKHVIILGKKENPYPYINACDIYVQPSRYEGKSVAVREAQLLHKPTVITNYMTSGSQLKDGYDGVIVPLDMDGCAEMLSRVILNKELQQQLIENTKKSDYTNVQEIKKIYQLMKG